MADRKLSDEEAMNRLGRASDALGVEPGASVRAATALTAARAALVMLMVSLEIATDEDSDEIKAVLKP